MEVSVYEESSLKMILAF